MGNNGRADREKQLREYRNEKARKEAEKKKAETKKTWMLIGVAMGILALIVGATLLITSLGKNKSQGDNNTAQTQSNLSVTPYQNLVVKEGLEDYEATDEVTNYVRMDIKFTNADGNEVTESLIVGLDPDCAPITVENFQNLVKDDYYDNSTFERINSTFVIQGGFASAANSSKTVNTIKGEFTQNGVNNPIKHERGVISMARSSAMDSASAQFFIVTQTSSTVTQSLDGNYAGFGKVLVGLDVVDDICGTELTTGTYTSVDGKASTPVNPVTVVSAYFVTPKN